MDLLLITKTPIIEKIFSLVCKKLDINFIVKSNAEISKNVDFIFVDEEFINDDFNFLKQYTKKLAAITSEELPFDKSRDFIINRPFLPAKLEELLLEQIEYIKEDVSLEELNYSKNIQDTPEELDEESLMSDYIESLADDVAHNIEDENDESIVTVASIKDGGVLDFNELGKINEILHDDEVHDEVNISKNDWKDINEIIDEALNEVKEYEFDLIQDDDKPVKILLNNYSISELKPFLQKFDQKVIDKLSNGEDVDVTLCLKVNK